MTAIRQNWLREIGAAIFLVTCIVGMGLLLYHEHDRPVHDQSWSHPFKPTVYVSIITAAIKVALSFIVSEAVGQLKWLHFSSKPRKLMDLQTFQSAGEGPEGALKLLFAVKHRAVLASVAAIIVLATSLIDPAFQIVIDLNEEVVNQTEWKILPQNPQYQVTNVYDSNNLVQQSGMDQPSLFNDSAQAPDLLTCNYTFKSNPAPNAKFQATAASAGGMDAESFSQSNSHTKFTSSTRANALDFTGFNFTTNGPFTGNLSELWSIKYGPPNVGEDGKSSSISCQEAMHCQFFLCVRHAERIKFSNGSVTFNNTSQTPLQVSRVEVEHVGTSKKILATLQPLVNTNYDGNATFSINGADYHNIGGWLSSFFMRDYSSDRFDATAEALYRFPDMNYLITNVANGMTEAILKVKWRYLALPAAITGLAIVLLIAVICRSINRQARVWKSSGLAVAAHDIPGLDRAHIRSVDELEKVAKTLKVQANDDEKGWLLTRQPAEA
ncbi:MAG: hypothetical protein Q9159_001869 [Coniocarpon cinnabarinum]